MRASAYVYASIHTYILCVRSFVRTGAQLYLLMAILTGVFCLDGKVNGKFVLTGVLRFYQSVFSGIKVLCNGPDVGFFLYIFYMTGYCFRLPCGTFCTA